MCGVALQETHSHMVVDSSYAIKQQTYTDTDATGPLFGDYHVIATTPKGVSTFVIKGLKPGCGYQFKVQGGL